MEKLTKHDIAAKVAGKMGISKAKAIKFTDALIESVREEIKEGNDVMLLNLVSFRHRTYSGRKVVVPTTGESHTIEDFEIVHAKASPTLYR